MPAGNDFDDGVLRVEGATTKPTESFLQQRIGGPADESAYAADAAADERPVEGDSLAALQALAQDLLNRRKKVEDLSAEVTKANDELADVEERRLPDMMELYGLPKFEFFDATTGTTQIIKLERKWRVSMPGNKPENEDKRKNIFEWFRTIGLSGIIKKTMEVPMGLVSDEKAVEIVMEFKKLHPDFDPGLSEKIEAATLTSQVTKLKDAGKNVNENIKVEPLRRAAVKTK